MHHKHMFSEIRNENMHCKHMFPEIRNENMHCKHMFPEIRNENCFSTEAHRGFVLDSKQKIMTQLQTIWL